MGGGLSVACVVSPGDLGGEPFPVAKALESGAGGKRRGVVRFPIGGKIGLDPWTPVFCGIHDSNASLLPHLLQRKAPFSVVSTGTWVISMAIGGRAIDLDPARDTLVNVNALGNPVRSARFMGGREFELLSDGMTAGTSESALQSVLDRKIMLLPSVQQGSGPFPFAQSRWGGEPSDEERVIAISFYLAMMTAICLDLIGAEGATVVEGPFALNAQYCDMLQAATGRPVLPQAAQATGTSIGAAMLAGTQRKASGADEGSKVLPAKWHAYARAWHDAVNAAGI